MITKENEGGASRDTRAFHSGLFSKKEFRSLFPSTITAYFRKRSGFRKYILLVFAETACYYPARSAAVFLKWLGKSLPRNKRRNAGR